MTMLVVTKLVVISSFFHHTTVERRIARSSRFSSFFFSYHFTINKQSSRGRIQMMKSGRICVFGGLWKIVLRCHSNSTSKWLIMLEYCLTCYVCIKRSFKRFTTILNFHFSHFSLVVIGVISPHWKEQKKWFFKVFFSSTCLRHTDTETENRAISVWIFLAGVKQKQSFSPQERSWRRRRAWMSTRFEEFISTFIIFSQWNLNCFRLCAFQCSKVARRSSRCRWSMSYDFWCLNVVVIAGSAPTSPSTKTLINVLSCCELPATNSEQLRGREWAGNSRWREISSNKKTLQYWKKCHFWTCLHFASCSMSSRVRMIDRKAVSCQSSFSIFYNSQL